MKGENCDQNLDVSDTAIFSINPITKIFEVETSTPFGSI